MTYGVEKASPELLRTIVPPFSDAHPWSISPSPRAAVLCLEWEAFLPGHSVGLCLPWLSPSSCSISCVLCQTAASKKAREAPATTRHLSSMFRRTGHWALMGVKWRHEQEKTPSSFSLAKPGQLMIKAPQEDFPLPSLGLHCHSPGPLTTRLWASFQVLLRQKQRTLVLGEPYTQLGTAVHL